MTAKLTRSLGRNLLVLVAILVMSALAATVSAQTAPAEWAVPTGSSQPTNLALDSFGNVWFTELAGNKIGMVNPNGVIQDWSISTPDSQPYDIVVDGANRVWFTEAAGNKIGNRTPGGVFGQDNVPTNDSEPRGIALDGSGNVWFAEAKGNKIGRFSPSNNSFTEYDVPTSNSQPWGVAVDPSGNVWFTERNSNKIGRLVPTGNGQFTEWGIPTGNSQPMGIAIDPSGNVWFTQYEGNKIGVYTPSTDSFNEYVISTNNSKPTNLAVDRASGVWYAGSGSNSYGRITGGNLEEYGFSSANSAPWGVAVDSGGSVWFTLQSANRIAKAAGAAPPPSTPTATPVPQPTPTPAPRDGRYYEATGFRVDNDVFWDYFNKRGGIRTFGYPVSRTFQFLGFTTQFFQRSIMQLGPDGTARTMNVLDPGLVPYTRINNSTFPAPDQGLASSAPMAGTPDYDMRVREFIRNNAPNQFEGLTVNFYQAFQSTVTLQDAYPQGGGNPGLLPLLNMELWGLPTSRPMRDPTNNNFVYLRFQRGVMHYDAANGYTQGLLLADFLKAILTGQNLPGDLNEQAKDSRFYKQYDSSRTNWIARPEQLPNTNLSYAFERQ